MNSKIAIFSLIAMVAAAFTLPGFNELMDGFMTPVSTPMGYLRSAVSNDDLQSNNSIYFVIISVWKL